MESSTCIIFRMWLFILDVCLSMQVMTLEITPKLLAKVSMLLSRVSKLFSAHLFWHSTDLCAFTAWSIFLWKYVLLFFLLFLKSYFSLVLLYLMEGCVYLSFSSLNLGVAVLGGLLAFFGLCLCFNAAASISFQALHCWWVCYTFLCEERRRLTIFIQYTIDLYRPVWLLPVRGITVHHWGALRYLHLPVDSGVVWRTTWAPAWNFQFLFEGNFHCPPEIR